MARIYISSTYSDLKELRKAIYDVLRKMGHDAIAMEDYVATDKRPLDKCLADVVRSDIYIGLFAWRYGYIPPNHEKSITELEFREAESRGKHCLLFLLHEDAPWPRSQADRDATRIEALRAELSRDYMVSFFRTADDLATTVSIATGAALEESAQARAVDRVTSEAASRRLEELPLDVVPERAPLPHGSVMPLRAPTRSSWAGTTNSKPSRRTSRLVTSPPEPSGHRSR
jgi:hypothetical protein